MSLAGWTGGAAPSPSGIEGRFAGSDGKHAVSLDVETCVHLPKPGQEAFFADGGPRMRSGTVSRLVKKRALASLELPVETDPIQGGRALEFAARLPETPDAGAAAQASAQTGA
ncbi:hypothetical protein NDU88_009546 [Pleurodeles waltl]|uniref:Uncharacterized protein n=1 Tax=Pleurodeles waltl TaxID=8319 RepID=A0AAV7S007_PLEWA|nr:hypothetical protein NDU88_009546 [Pleurodeles waltl]